jgi:hypothetical protein
MAYANCEASYRIAIVGDSFTFGLHLPYTDTWGARLTSALGNECIVLNFGVDGYGVDQAYLRYLRDARPWRPRMVILGFIAHDLYRALSVYTFITFPEGGFPFSKPRFLANGQELRLLNVPLISPESIAATRSIQELPFVEYDPGYSADDWRWHWYYSSRLVRFVASRWRGARPGNREVGESALTQINGDLLVDFARVASREGSIPLVVYFPRQIDYTSPDPAEKDSVFAVLQLSGVDHVDLTTCIKDSGLTAAYFLPDGHYTAKGNAAVARCLIPKVRELLSRP